MNERLESRKTKVTVSMSARAGFSFFFFSFLKEVRKRRGKLFRGSVVNYICLFFCARLPSRFKQMHHTVDETACNYMSRATGLKKNFIKHIRVIFYMSNAFVLHSFLLLLCDLATEKYQIFLPLLHCCSCVLILMSNFL